MGQKRQKERMGQMEGIRKMDENRQVTITNREEAARTLLSMLRPLKDRFSPGHARLFIGDTGVHYGTRIGSMEGVLRLLWGLGPLWAGEKGLSKEVREEGEQWRRWYLAAIVHGTDPGHEEYWGDIGDYDQKMVEMAPLAVAISLNPTGLWEPLAPEEQERLYQYLNQMNEKKVHSNNWRFFRILVNMAFRLLGRSFSAGRLEEDKAVIEGCYLKGGWYYDGNPGQVDYYIPFAMHFYGLIYSRLMEGEEPEYCAVLKERASRFSEDFVYWFNGEGDEIPFGRSLTYRFAHSALFGALPFAGVPGIGYGIMKRLLLKNLERWLSRPIFDSAGILTIGYGYPNLLMSEGYNGPGSPYWGLKAFFMLALPDSNPFWQAKEQEFAYEERKYLQGPRMLVTHGVDGHVISYPVGQHCNNHGHCREKYEKFAYSNHFGFSISREAGLKEGAFDSTLAFSASGEDFYRMRYGVDGYEGNEQAVKSAYSPMKGVKVQSVVIPFGAWHVRVHRIETLLELDVAEGGFSIKAEEGELKYTPDMMMEGEGSVFAVPPWGVSGIASLTGGIPVLIRCFPNTNLLYNLTILPMIKSRLSPGSHSLISCIYASKKVDLGEWGELPKVRLEGEVITANYRGRVVKEGFLYSL